MAQRTRLSVKDFPLPLVSDDLGNTSFINSYDQEEKQPLPYWVENVMPTLNGVKTVAYSEKFKIPLPEKFLPFAPTKLYTQVVYGANGESCILMLYNNYLLLYTLRTNAWVELAPTVSFDGLEPNVCKVKDVIYIFHKNLGIKRLDTINAALADVTLIGLEQGLIDSIGAVNNYLVVVIDSVIFWSTPTNSLEFTPILNQVNTGAGSSSIQGLKGVIIHSVAIGTSLLLFTNYHIIAMRMTGNSLNPWTFKEVQNSFGVATPRHVAINNSGALYVWSSAGLQAVSDTEAVNVFPEITDFLKGGIIERRKAGSTFEIEKFQGLILDIRLAFVSGRFLCVSYGTAGLYEFVLVYDSGLKRWGKLAYNHYEIIEDVVMQAGFKRYMDLTAPYLAYMATPVKSLDGDSYKNIQTPNAFCLVGSNGSIIQVSSSDRINASTEGLMLYGRLSQTRTSMLTLLELRFRRFEAPNGKLIVKSEFDEPQYDFEQELIPHPDFVDTWYLMQEARNHFIAVKGTFTITCLEATLVKSSRVQERASIMSTNVCAQFKLQPPPATAAEVADFNRTRECLENQQQAIVTLLQEVAKLRDEVNTLRGL